MDGSHYSSSKVAHHGMINHCIHSNHQDLHIESLEATNRSVQASYDQECKHRISQERTHTKRIIDLEYQINELKIWAMHSKSPVKTKGTRETEERVHGNNATLDLTDRLAKANEINKGLEAHVKQTALNLKDIETENRKLVRVNSRLREDNQVLVQSCQEYQLMISELQNQHEQCSYSYFDSPSRSDWMTLLADSSLDFHGQIY